MIKEPRLAIREIELPEGHNKQGQTFPRKVLIQPGYDDLLHIVAGLQKDVKRINKCLTLDGAKEYASKRKNWSAHEEDITGPNGKPDGIKEVFVCDAQGNLKVVNGVGLGKTSYPLRKAHASINPINSETGKKIGLSEFKRRIGELNETLDSNGFPMYDINLVNEPKGGPQFRGLQPQITARNAYKKLIFDTVSGDTKEEMKETGIAPLEMAHIVGKTLKLCYDEHVVKPVLMSAFGTSDITRLPKGTYNRFKKSSNFEDALMQRVLQIYNDDSLLDEVKSDIQKAFGGDDLNQTVSFIEAE